MLSLLRFAFLCFAGTWADVDRFCSVSYCQLARASVDFGGGVVVLDSCFLFNLSFP